MSDYVKPYIEKIESFLGKGNEHIEILLIGGLAMSFYNIPRYTVDIDAEIKCSNEVYPELMEYLKEKGVVSNISDNINGWGIVPLPDKYKERANTVYKSDYLTIKVLEPADFVFSKILRGTQDDFNDALEVIKRYKITKDVIIERKKIIKFPKDPETFFFQKKFQHLLELMNEI